MVSSQYGPHSGKRYVSWILFVSFSLVSLCCTGEIRKTELTVKDEVADATDIVQITFSGLRITISVQM